MQEHERERGLAGYDSQQIPTNNDIQGMLIIIISLRWKHICYHIISVSNPNNGLYNVKGTQDQTYRYSHS